MAESLVIENESLLLKLQQLVEQTQENNSSQGKSVRFNLDPEHEAQEQEEGEENLENVETGEAEKTEEETGWRQQTGRSNIQVLSLGPPR